METGVINIAMWKLDIIAIAQEPQITAIQDGDQWSLELISQQMVITSIFIGMLLSSFLLILSSM